MARYQLLECNVALAGDVMNVVARHAGRPVTYAELIVLQYLHGENAITDVFEVGETEDVDPKDEMNRLAETYGEVVRRQLFPGHNIQMPVRNNRFKPRLIKQVYEPPPPDELVYDNEMPGHQSAPVRMPENILANAFEPEPEPEVVIPVGAASLEKSRRK